MDGQSIQPSIHLFIYVYFVLFINPSEYLTRTCSERQLGHRICTPVGGKRNFHNISIAALSLLAIYEESRTNAGKIRNVLAFHRPRRR